MSMPERIWADLSTVILLMNDHTKEADFSLQDEGIGDIEYVRADIVEELERRITELNEEIDSLEDLVEGVQ